MGSAPKACSYTAGLHGALLMVCPAPGKSPAESASEVTSLGQAETPKGENPATGAGLAPAPSEPAPQLAEQAQQQRQQPDGRPLRRVKSRRQVHAWWQGLGTGGPVSGNCQMDVCAELGIA